MMLVECSRVAVAGYTCLDITPEFALPPGRPDSLVNPGALLNVGPLYVSGGGVVSNTGLALHQLGAPTLLMGKVGDDLWGRLTIDMLRSSDTALGDGMIVAQGQPSSYTVVIDPPDADRAFLHFAGPNRDFGIGDIPYEQLDGQGIFHFGYPPLMPRLYRNDGAEMADLFHRAKHAGQTTALDVTLPDGGSEVGQLDWRVWLDNVLPHVDLFLPNLPELLFMLGHRRQGPEQSVDGALVRELAGQLLEMGAAIAVVKLGDAGVYVRTTADPGRLALCGLPAACDIRAWHGRELWAPSFKVEVARTLGAGDSAVAGFLCGLAQGLSPEETLQGAVATGAYNVERADPAVPLPGWAEVMSRVRAGWLTLPVAIPLPGWRWDDDAGLWVGPGDARFSG
jgi:sugar/nucleoside kinase (ribokinase family)